jgi:uncharacterized protein (DUF885 family)
MSFNRRTLLTASAAGLALQAIPGCASALAAAGDAVADQLLARITEEMFSDYPETATSSGVDKDARAGLRSRLGNRSAAGQSAIERRTRDTLAQLRRVSIDALNASNRIHVDVVRTAYELAADGFGFPYGDVAILNANWSYRNSPYIVAQNVGAFVEIPSFLDSSHSINSAADADAYLARIEAYAGQLDGETERVRADTARGVVLPDFLLNKTVN